MSLEAILSRIREEAGEKAGNLLAAAEKEKNAALEKYTEELESGYRKNIEKIKSGMAEEMKRKEFHVRREAARKILNARRTMMDNAIKKAVTNLASTSDSEYLGMISSLLRSCDLQGKIEVLISRDDESRITPEYLKKHSDKNREFVISDERHPENGGVIFKSGKISQNGTFSMIAELAHEDIVMLLSNLIPLEKN